MKTLRVSFEITPERIGTVLGLIVSEVSHLSVTDVANGDARPARHRPSRPLVRRGPEETKGMSKGELVATSELGQFILKAMEKRLRADSSEIALLLGQDGRWSKATASPTLSLLKQAGFLTKDDPRPGMPYVYVKAPAVKK